MSTGQHTPGPWQILPEEAGKAYIRIRGTQLGTTYKIANVLVHTYPWADDRELIEARHNAHLIAAAPDLLTLCEACLRVLYEDEHPDLRQALREAIAKARGADVGGETP